MDITRRLLLTLGSALPAIPVTASAASVETGAQHIAFTAPRGIYWAEGKNREIVKLDLWEPHEREYWEKLIEQSPILRNKIRTMSYWRSHLRDSGY